MAHRDTPHVPVFERFASAATRFSGSVPAFAARRPVIVVWVVTGPIFGFSDTWQLVINTGTTIVTFLMVFLIQRAQNKDALAIHLKLNELVAALEGASNRLINVENLTADELRILHAHYRTPRPAREGSRRYQRVPFHRRSGAPPQEQGTSRQALSGHAGHGRCQASETRR